MSKVCPQCGQQIYTKHGVKLQKMKAAIFEDIENSSPRGISRETLAWVFYPGVETETAKKRISAQVCQINDMMISTDYRIKSVGGFYRVVCGAAA